MKETRRILLQIGLFILTIITTTIAGAEWTYGKSVFDPAYTWDDFLSGFAFSIPMITILTVHEFGHYFVALYHRVKTSLPYYIPIPPIPGMPFFSIGTMGAVIRLRSHPENNLKHFDIGLAGPLAGFIVAVGFLIYGYATLPPADYVFQFHPEYEQYGANYADVVYSQAYYNKIYAAEQPDSVRMGIDVVIGKSLIFQLAEQFVSDKSRIPNGHELMHYPVLLATFIALFITSLNLLPIGQLDGGHVVYGLFGYRGHRVIATTFFIALFVYAGLGNEYIAFGQPPAEWLLKIALYGVFLFFAFGGLRRPVKETVMIALLVLAFQLIMARVLPDVKGYFMWMVLGFILGRFIGVEHPRSEVELPLNGTRVMLGWLTLLIFILCFSMMPVDATIITAER